MKIKDRSLLDAHDRCKKALDESKTCAHCGKQSMPNLYDNAGWLIFNGRITLLHGSYSSVAAVTLAIDPQKEKYFCGFECFWEYVFEFDCRHINKARKK